MPCHLFRGHMEYRFSRIVLKVDVALLLICVQFPVCKFRQAYVMLSLRARGWLLHGFTWCVPSTSQGGKYVAPQHNVQKVQDWICHHYESCMTMNREEGSENPSTEQFRSNVNFVTFDSEVSAVRVSKQFQYTWCAVDKYSDILLNWGHAVAQLVEAL
jgi:hypothetical protein